MESSGIFYMSGPTSKVTLMKAVDELVWANVAGVCADLLLSYQRNSVRVVGGGNGGDEGGSRRF